MKILIENKTKEMNAGDRQLWENLLDIMKKFRGYYTCDFEAIKQLLFAFFFGSNEQELEMDERVWVRDRFFGSRIPELDIEHRNIKLEELLGEMKRHGLLSDKLTASLLALKLYAYEKVNDREKHVKYINAIQHTMKVSFDGAKDRELRALLNQLINRV